VGSVAAGFPSLPGIEHLFYSFGMNKRVSDLESRRRAARHMAGIPLTDEGKARARERLADADRRMTAKRWKALRTRLGRGKSAA